MKKIFLKHLPCYALILLIISCLSLVITTGLFGNIPLQKPDVFELIEAKKILLLYLLPAAFVEEVLFRFLPFFLVIEIKKNFLEKTSKNTLIFIIVTISSILFGYLHGNWRNIFIQGTAGFYFSFIFWRYSFRVKNHRTLLNGLVASGVFHWVYNTALISVLLVVRHYKK